MIAKNKKIKKESRLQNIFFSVFLAVLFFGFFGFLVVSNFRINQKRSEMTDKIETLKKEIETLEQKNKNLQAGISQATSTAFQEEKMREQGYQKPGEQNVVVLPPENKQETSTEQPKTWWQKIWEEFNF